MIRVLIDRQLVPGNDDAFRKAMQQVRRQALRIPGYISGETLRDSEEPHHCLVISTWHSRTEWDAWAASAVRQRMRDEIALLLVEPERVTVLEPF